MTDEHLRFGESGTFAIEVEVLERRGPHDFVRLFVWLGGERIGHADEVNLVGAMKGSAKDFLQRWPSDSPAEFARLDPEATFRTIHDAYFEDHPAGEGPSPDRITALGRHVLLPNGCVSFDGVYAFALRSSQRDRVVYRSPVSGEVREILLAPGVIESAFKAFLAHPWSS